MEALANTAIILMGYFCWVAILSLVGASALFLIKKNGWDEKYQLHRKLWMPNWCDACSTLWASLPVAILVSFFAGQLFWLAAVIAVPPFAIIVYDKFAGNGNK